MKNRVKIKVIKIPFSREMQQNNRQKQVRRQIAETTNNRQPAIYMRKLDEKSHSRENKRNIIKVCILNREHI